VDTILGILPGENYFNTRALADIVSMCLHSCQQMGCLGGAEIIAGVLIMKIGSIIVVIIIGMTRTALLMSS
jgi:hypothetical protein